MTNPDLFPYDIPHVYHESSPSTACSSLAWAGPDPLVDPLVLTRQVYCAECSSQFLKVRPPIALKMIFNSSCNI